MNIEEEFIQGPLR
jgi:hypothetical protein